MYNTFVKSENKQPKESGEYLVVTDDGTMTGIYNSNTQEWHNRNNENIITIAWVEYWDGAEHI